MTLLTVVQQVCPVIGLTVPTAVASSTDREHIELVSLASEMAVRIANANDWEVYTTLGTLTGDGSALSFSLPSDYARMNKDTQLWSSSLSAPLKHITSRDEWLGNDVQPVGRVVNAWTKYGGLIYISPALANAATAKFFYQTTGIIQPVSGANKGTFTVDTDVFPAGDRLLRLGMIWQWKANKGLEYHEDMENFEEALAQAITHDKGPRTFRIGRGRSMRGVDPVWPGTVG